MKLGLLEDGWPHTRITHDVNRLSLPLPHASSSSIATNTQETSTETQYAPSSLSSASSQNIGPGTQDVSDARDSMIADFSKVFSEEPFRAMEGPPMHIDLVDGTVPCRHYRARSIPFRWKESVFKQLAEMEAKGVIEKVPTGESYQWCHPMVVVPKKNSTEPRITVDLTGLNRFVKRPAYPTRSPREVVAAIPPGMKFFTTLDSRHGYWQVPLDKESSALTTFITPWGAYRFLRNVMGLVSAGDEHNRRGDDALAGLDNVQKVVEDVIVYDADFATH